MLGAPGLEATFTASEVKLLRHLDRLVSFRDGVIRPIQVQMAPTETCDEACSFCSMANRPLGKQLAFAEIRIALEAFAQLGAKSLELTGGGNPILYRDPVSKRTINDIITLATELGLKAG